MHFAGSIMPDAVSLWRLASADLMFLLDKAGVIYPALQGDLLAFPRQCYKPPTLPATEPSRLIFVLFCISSIADKMSATWAWTFKPSIIPYRFLLSRILIIDLSSPNMLAFIVVSTL